MKINNCYRVVKMALDFYQHDQIESSWIKGKHNNLTPGIREYKDVEGVWIRFMFIKCKFC